MALRPQTSAITAELLAAGVVRNDASDPSILYAPDGTPLEALSPTTVQTASPVTGATITLADDARSTLLYLTPAATLAALTITLPSNAKSRIGQQERVFSTQIITALTVSGSGQTVVNPATTIAANGTLLYQKVAANTWLRVT